MAEQQLSILERKGLKFKPYISSEQIQKETARVAAEISADYRTKNPILVGVLNGSFMWTADLVRQLDFQDFEIEFCKISSYAGESSTGTVKQLIGLKNDVKGRHLIIIEDIVDTGHTMASVIPWIQSKEPASVSLASLFWKQECTKTAIKIDYIGFKIQPQFIIGYGLDFDEWGRNLKDVWIKVDEKENSQEKVEEKI